MKPILIIKTGTVKDEFLGAHQDFDDMILRNAGVESTLAKIVSVFKGEQLPEPDEVCGAIITGSVAMVTDRAPWSLYTEKWVRNAGETGLPILGICYGHQLLAQAFGGIVEYHPQGMELGTVSISLNENGIQDKLLGILPESFIGHVIHSQCVAKLPQKAINLAFNEYENQHAFRIGENVWGVQFHPEFTAAFMRDFIQLEEKNLGKSIEELGAIKNNLEENKYGEILLQRFFEIACLKNEK